MARPLRIQYPGAMYHIISRGIGRMTIFHNEKDWKKFIQFRNHWGLAGNLAVHDL